MITNKRNFSKTEKGITLIALVITVIVLLILARHFDFNVKPVIIAYFQGQEKQK